MVHISMNTVSAFHGVSVVGSNLTAWGKAVDIIQVASILSAAAFAAFALFAEYKKGGKITRAGRFAVIGIVLSAILSLATQWGKAEIDRLKGEAADAKQRELMAGEIRRYRDQMTALGSLVIGNRELAADMGRSLVNGRQLQQQTRNTLVAVQATRFQENQNTEHTLRTMWEDTNRVDESRIVASIAYSCETVRGRIVPALLVDNVFLEIGLIPRDHASDYSIPEYTIYPRIPFSTLMRPGSTTRLISYRQETTSRRFGSSLMYSIDFSHFFAASLGEFTNPEAWHQAAIEVTVSARLNMSEADLAETLAPMQTRPTELETYSFTQGELENTRLRWSVLPCQAELIVTVNGRVVLEQRPQILLLSGWGYFEGPTVFIRSYPVQVNDRAFPSFFGPQRTSKPLVVSRQFLPPSPLRHGSARSR